MWLDIRQTESLTQNADPRENQTVDLTVFASVLLFTTTLSIVMRLVSRRITKYGLARDDWTFLVGAVLTLGLCITSIIYSTRAGLGAHWVYLTPAQKSLFQRLNYAYNIFNLAAFPLIKISILFLYLRIFISSRIRIFCWVGIGFLACMMTANVLVTIFACQPIQAFWDLTITNGKCINLTSFSWATAILNIITDLYLLVLPMPVVWNIQTTLRKKIAISLIFVLGTLTFITSIVRIIYYVGFVPTDPSWSFLGAAYATPAETCLAVIVASAPTWRPVWARVSDMASQAFSSMRDRSLSRITSGNEHAPPFEVQKDVPRKPSNTDTLEEELNLAKIPSASASGHATDNTSLTAFDPV